MYFWHMYKYKWYLYQSEETTFHDSMNYNLWPLIQLFYMKLKI